MAGPGDVRVHVQVLDSQDLVVVPASHLPAVADDVLEVLAAEAAPLHVWLDFAKMYLARGNEEAFKHICQEAAKEEVSQECLRFFGRLPTYEQVQFNCALAALHMAKAKEETEQVGRSTHIDNATRHIQAARALCAEEQLVSLAEGMLCWQQGDLNKARQEFLRASSQRNNGHVNIAPLLALGLLSFQAQQYKDALQLFRRALVDNPAAPAEVRLGIAACCYKLGDMAGATAAYERALAVDPDCADALVGLAMIKSSQQSNLQQGLADGLKLLVRAYELEPTHIGVLLMVAHFCLLREEHSKVLVAARAALDVANTDALRSQCHCFLARAQHALGDFSQAFQHYAQAGKLDPGAAIPHLGLAQLYINQGVATNAVTELEAALQAAPTLFDALKLLGQLVSGDVGKTQQVLKLLRGAVGRCEQDADMWELLGELSAQAGDHAGALVSYEKALGLHRVKQQGAQQEQARRAEERTGSQTQRQGERDALFGDSDDLEGGEEEEQGAGGAHKPAYHIPTRLLNNTAVLLYRAGKLEEAAQLEELLQGQEPQDQAHRSALEYNMARIKEASGQYKQAEALYQAMLLQDPANVDCLLRLACLSRAKGDTKGALDYTNKALKQQAGNADALALLSQLYMERRDYQSAGVRIQQLLGKEPGGIATHDIYGQVAYGNLLLATVPSERKRPSEVHKAETQLYKALEQFRAVLKEQPRNAFAANGVGAVLAELGRLEEAQEVFSEVQAAVAASDGFLHIPDMYVNLANVALAKQEYVSAQRLYHIAQDKLGSTKRTTVLLYLARSYYDSGDLKHAKTCLQHAVHLAPTDYKLRFNLSLVLQEFAVRTFSKKRAPGDPRKLEEFLTAELELRNASLYFEHLQTQGTARTGLDPNKLTKHVSFCKDQAVMARKLLEMAREEDAHLVARRKAQEELRGVEAQQKQIEVMKREAAAAAEQQARERRARDAKSRQEKVKEAWRSSQVEVEVDAQAGGKKKKGPKPGKKGGKKGARGMAGDDEEPSEDEEKVLKEGDDLFGDDEDDADAQAQEKNMLAEAGLASSDDEGGDAAAGIVQGRLKRGRGEDEDGQQHGAGDDLFEDEVGEQDAAEPGDGGSLQQGEPAGKRSKRGGAVMDSEDEAEAEMDPAEDGTQPELPAEGDEHDEPIEHHNE